MKQLKTITILFAVLFGLASQSAKAVLIDQGTSVVDTTAGLEWLKLTSTDAMSVATAVATYGADGWGLASSVQYHSLFDAIIPSYVDPDGNGYESVYPGSEMYAQSLVFRSLFGITYDYPTLSASASYGFYEGSDGLLHLGGVYYGSTWANLYRDYAVSFDQYRTTVHANVGIFMVRALAVPEPTTLLLLGLGLLGLGLARRKSK